MITHPDPGDQTPLYPQILTKKRSSGTICSLEIIIYSMKKVIHPQYFTDTKVTCACGNAFVTGSTLKEIRIELCSQCHPFYTGKQKFVDTARRVEKFQEKMSKVAGIAATRKGKKVKKAAVAAKRSAKKASKEETTKSEA